MAQTEDSGEARGLMDNLTGVAREGERQEIEVCVMRVSS